jgi:competence ComEA-like helix-hairpin-helix protein
MNPAPGLGPDSRAVWKPWRPGAVAAVAATLVLLALLSLFSAWVRWQPAAWVWPGPENAQLELNQASAAEWAALPGIGPVLAGRIVAWREQHGGFRSPEDLLAVKGLGPRKLERLRPWLADPPAGNSIH